MPQKKFLILLVVFNLPVLLTSCVKTLDVTPVTIDAHAKLGYAIPTDPKKPSYDIDLSNDLSGINKMVCFTIDDLSQIERALNK